MPTILFLETNPAGNGCRAMRHAQDWGYRAHFLTRDPAQYEQLSNCPTEIADEVITVDTLDIAKLLRPQYSSDVVATIAFDELRVIPAAVLGEYLGTLHNPPIRGLVNARFKDRMRTRLAGTQHAVRHDVVALADRIRDSPVGYPCVIKPVDEAGSTGVRVCGDPDEFRAGVETVRKMAVAPNRRGYRITPALLIEEYVVGEEYSAELVWSHRNSAWRLVGFTRKHISPAPWCLEIGELFPHSFGRQKDRRVLQQLRDCLHQIGLRATAAHVEFRLVDEDVRVIDVNPRSAGDRIPDLVQYATGVDLVALHLAAHLGTADALLDRTAHRGYAGVRYLVPPHPGTVVGYDIAPDDDGALIDLRTAPTPLTALPPTSNSAQTVQVVAGAEAPEEVDRALTRHAARVTHRYVTAAEPWRTEDEKAA